MGKKVPVLQRLRICALITEVRQAGSHRRFTAPIAATPPSPDEVTSRGFKRLASFSSLFHFSFPLLGARHQSLGFKSNYIKKENSKQIIQPQGRYKFRRDLRKP